MHTGSYEQRLAEARAMLASAGSVTVLTGSGVSAESGIPTFRGAGGLWQGMRAEDFATPEGFARNPEKVLRWYDQRRMQLNQVAPNPAHVALAKLERQVTARGGQFALATQNVDGLHQAAGSRHVLELHGSLQEARCNSCDYRQRVGLGPVEPVRRCPRCGEYLRPAVVWFGEPLPQPVLAAAIDAARRCEVFLAVGTSAIVYPAAGLIDVAARAGAKAVEVNIEPTPATAAADVALHGKAGDILPRLV